VKILFLRFFSEKKDWSEKRGLKGNAQKKLKVKSWNLGFLLMALNT
jgi:hypothetical protein